jgi:hypothetical protein
VQWMMEIVIGGVLPHRPKIFISSMHLMVSPSSPINDRPNLLASLHESFYFHCTQLQNSNLTIPH